MSAIRHYPTLSGTILAAALLLLAGCGGRDSEGAASSRIAAEQAAARAEKAAERAEAAASGARNAAAPGMVEDEPVDPSEEQDPDAAETAEPDSEQTNSGN